MLTVFALSLKGQVRKPFVKILEKKEKIKGAVLREARQRPREALPSPPLE